MDLVSSITSITPIVLCGGGSRRFGRDKLREPMPGGGWLIDRPIAALRAVFGPRVMLVGREDAEIASRADGVIRDSYPGVGPAGGILSALRALSAPVFVLAGDLPCISADAVRVVLGAAGAHPGALAVLGAAPEAQPCIGLYRPGAAAFLERSVALRPPGPLAGAVPAGMRVLADIGPASAVNANTPEELARHIGRGG